MLHVATGTRRNLYYRVLIGAALSWSGIAAAQDAPAAAQPTPPSVQTAPSQAGEIVVEGIAVPGEEAPQESLTPGGPGRTSGIDPSQTPIANRQKYDWSDIYVRCVMSSARLRKTELRDVVDGPFNYSTQAYAQDLLARRNASCLQHSFQTHAVDPPGLGYSIYDRGAYLVEAIRTYAPALKLTRRETGDQKVQSRFNLREMPRNRYRLPVDYRYFEVAVCAVRLQPTLSVALVATPHAEPAKIRRIENAIVSGSRICFGNAKKVFFDPTQFRIYIADAVYRWVVAARGVDSLIPLE